MESLTQDIRYALRQLARAPGFTAVVVLTLALGIGLNVAVFTIVNAVLLRPLPVERPRELVNVFTSEGSAHGVSDRRYGATSYPDYVDLRERARSFSGVMAYVSSGFWLREGEYTRVLAGAYVSGNYFRVLGTRPALGRFFADDEDDPRSPAMVAVLSHSQWLHRFGGDSAILGRQLEVDGRLLTVIGVARPEALGPDTRASAALFVPFAVRPLREGPESLRGRGDRSLRVIGRLAPGVTMQTAQTELNAIMADLARAHPAFNADRVFTATSAATLLGQVEETERVRQVAVAALAVTLLVLCIASLNVANLLIARAVRRRRELAVRVSLGASRGRVVRQLLTESAVLALLGVGVALLAVSWMPGLLGLLPIPSVVDLPIDGRVLAFSAAAVLFATLAFGLAPALQAVRPSLADALKDGSIAPRQRGRLRGALVATQVALSVVLLVTSGLFVRTLLAAANVAPGFATHDVLSVHVALADDAAPASRAYFETLMERVAALPGVQSASLAAAVPLAGGARRSVTIPDYVEAPREDMEVPFNVVSPGYFRTLDIPIVRGRDFRSHAGSIPEVIVNETFARRYFAGRDALGRRIHLGSVAAPAAEVVGIARDAKYRALNEPDIPYFYIQWPQGGLATALQIRFTGPAQPVAAAVRREATAVDSRAQIMGVRTLDDVLRGSLTSRRVAAIAVGSFGLLALILASLGLYGLQSYVVAERSREIGVRMALGADGRRVVRLVLRQGIRVAALGAVLGIPLAVGAGRVAAQALYGVRPEDPVTYASVALTLGLVTVAASWLPARRAARVDPVEALRRE